MHLNMLDQPWEDTVLGQTGKNSQISNINLWPIHLRGRSISWKHRGITVMNLSFAAKLIEQDTEQQSYGKWRRQKRPMNPVSAMILSSLCSLRNAVLPEKIRPVSTVLSKLFFKYNYRLKKPLLLPGWDRKCPPEPCCLGPQHQNRASDCWPDWVEQQL
jgi:hypothetical protein